MSHSTRPRVVDPRDQNIAGADGAELVHDRRDALALDHGADGDPAALLERVDRGCALSGGDFAGGLELRALDIVGAEDVFLGGCSSG